MFDIVRAVPASEGKNGQCGAVCGRRGEQTRSEDGGAGEKGGVVGMNGGGARFSVSVSPAGMNGWSGFRENAAQRVLRAQNAVFRPFFYIFYALRPVMPPPRGALRFDDDETAIVRVTPELDIVLHPVHDPHSQAKHLNRGCNYWTMPCVSLLQRLFLFVLCE